MTEVDLTKEKVFSRSSHLVMFCKIGVLKYLTKFIGKHLHRILFE